MHILEKKKEERSREYAFRVLRYNIVERKLEPGMLVSEKDLAQELGVSRTPVREALIELSKVSVVDVKPQVGYQIAPIDYQIVSEVQFTRKTLECAVIELACEEQTEEGMRKIEENLNLQEFYLEKKDRDQLFLLDQQYHRLFFEMTNKLLSYQMLDMISIPFERVRKMSMDKDEKFPTIRDHHRMFQYVKDHDAENAKKLMEEHLTRYKVDEAMIMGNYPQSYFVNQ